MSIIAMVVVLGYPVLQAWALWQCQGGWRVAAWAVLLTAGLAYLRCVWVLFVAPLLAPSTSNFHGLFEGLGLLFGGPVVLIVLAVIIMKSNVMS